jgi:hypothetical protein
MFAASKILPLSFEVYLTGDIDFLSLKGEGLRTFI